QVGTQPQRRSPSDRVDHVGRGPGIHRQPQRPVSREQGGQGQGGTTAAGVARDLARGSGGSRAHRRRDQSEVRAAVQGMRKGVSLLGARHSSRASSSVVAADERHWSGTLPAKTLDASRPVLIAVTVLLALMIVVPMAWLIVYSFSDKDGHATLA